jgi:predicted RNA-binding Zn-ribbon protein involved in translation (DUF1610 family)
VCKGGGNKITVFKHAHVWKTTYATLSGMHGFDESTRTEVCKCGEWRQVTVHKCSDCGHEDIKRTFTSRLFSAKVYDNDNKQEEK